MKPKRLVQICASMALCASCSVWPVAAGAQTPRYQPSGTVAAQTVSAEQSDAPYGAAPVTGVARNCVDTTADNTSPNAIVFCTDNNNASSGNSTCFVE